MDRTLYDLPAFRQKINTPYSSIFYVSGDRGVVYYCRDGQYIASAHKLEPTEGKYEDEILHSIPSRMWHVVYQTIVETVDELYEVYTHEIESEWIK